MQRTSKKGTLYVSNPRPATVQARIARIQTAIQKAKAAEARAHNRANRLMATLSVAEKQLVTSQIHWAGRAARASSGGRGPKSISEALASSAAREQKRRISGRPTKRDKINLHYPHHSTWEG